MVGSFRVLRLCFSNISATGMSGMGLFSLGEGLGVIGTGIRAGAGEGQQLVEPPEVRRRDGHAAGAGGGRATRWVTGSPAGGGADDGSAPGSCACCACTFSITNSARSTCR